MNPMGAELEAIFNRVADEIASDADELRLGELLRSDPGARKAYREFMALHSALHWDYVAAVAPAQAPKMDSPELASAVGLRTGWLAAFLAGLIVAGIVGVAVMRPGPPTIIERPLDPDPRPGDTRRGEEIAALLVDEVAAQFAEGRAPDGVRFGPQEYELVTGMVHLRFAQGADLVLVGPARLEVKDAQHVQLLFGKIRVTAPPTAKGFTIRTDAADYVDLGTEFGLQVDAQSGASDLYVFDGQVNIADPGSGKVLSEVTEGESSRYLDGMTGVAPQLTEADFPTPGAIGFQRWKRFEEEIRQDRGLVAFFPFRRMADHSVLANALSEEAMADGRIAGARWVSGRWPGKDALLFDRDTDFVEIDISGEYEELTVAAWLNVDRLDFGLNAILNSDGYDLGDLHFQLTRQGYPRGGVVIEGRFVDRVLGNSVPIGEWAHVASVLSTRTRSQQIYVNGALARERIWESDEIVRPGSCRLGNWLPVAHAGPENRAFRGRVDELAVWNRALSEDEVKQMVEAGRPGLIWSKK